MTVKFDFVSRLIDLRRLERETRPLLYRGFLLAVVFHAFLAVFLRFDIALVEIDEYRALPIELIIRPPRLSRPFTVTGRPVSREYAYRSRYRPRNPSGTVETRRPPAVPTPSLSDSLDIAFTEDSTIDSLAITIETRRPETAPPPRLRSMPAIDPGAYRAEIFYDPLDKLNAAGFVHIPIVQGRMFIPPEPMRIAVTGLARVTNDLTNIRAVVDNPLPELDFNIWKDLDPIQTRGVTFESLLKNRPPLLYILGMGDIPFSETEIEIIYRYIRGGGTLIVENGRPGNERVREDLLKFMSYACRGYDFFTGRRPGKPVLTLPDDHPIHDCFFTFPDGPPPGAGQRYGGVLFKTTSHLQGIMMNGRFAAIYSDRGYGLMWRNAEVHRDQARFGVNMLVYALAQRTITAHAKTALP